EGRGVRRMTPQEPKLAAEVRIYDLLASKLSFGWTVFYDVAWLALTTPGDAPRDGQVDFIAAHPRRGVLLIEVKGGRIHFDAPRRQWISTDRTGQEHDIDPFGQVRTSKYALLNKLKSLPALRNRWIELAHAVCFPASQRPRTAVTPDALPEIIIGSDDLDRVEQRIDQILAFSRGGRAFEGGDSLVHQLTDLLGRSVTLPNPLATQVREDEQEIVRLTESQLRVLTLLSQVRRAAVGGAAGSGKTFLAVEKAKRLAAEGFRTLLACSSIRLANHLSELTAGVADLDVLSVSELARRWSTASAGSAAPSPCDPAIALFDAMGARSERPYDAIVVDEGQDMTSEWWLALESCLRDGRGSVFYVFHDTHQSLNSAGGILPDGMAEISLEDNVRNTQSICTAVNRHYEGSVAIISRGPAGRSVEVIPYDNAEQLAKMLARVLQRLLVTERLSASDLVVLTPRPVDSSSIAGLRLASGFTVSSGFAIRDSKQIELASIEQFKGLERKIAILVELDDRLPDSTALRGVLCYVACSRPRTHLIVLGLRDVLKSLGFEEGD
ncbi:MAG TPA: NERD domain-containing protein, partial [Pirellulales bacterium]|nr:NERD domain-containing protein [Pirellulales bacterium]